MKKLAFPTTGETVDDVMRRWPATIRIFIDFRMHCIGCPIATFHTVEDACGEHGIDLETFLRSLHSAVQRPADTCFDRPSASANRP